MVPWLADKYGRKWAVLTSIYVFSFSVLVIMEGSELVILYVFLFIAGMTYGGRIVVGINYQLEFMPSSTQEILLTVKLFCSPILLIILTIIF